MKKEKKSELSIAFIIGVFFIISILSGCASTKAATGPRMKDLSVLEIGTDRHVVLAELDSPVHSEVEDGHKIDIFRFIQGQHVSVKAAKSVYYGMAAIVTLGISEVVTNPIEGTVGKGSELQFKIIYDEDDKVERVDVLKDNRWFPMQELSDTDSKS